MPNLLRSLVLTLAVAVLAWAGPTLAAVERTWSGDFATPAIDHQVNCSVRWRGGVVVGGGFSLAGNIHARNIAWWDGTSWRDLGGGLDGQVFCVAVVRDTLVVGGNFTHAGGVAMPGIARWTGSRWIPMGAGLGDKSSSGVHALTKYRDMLVAVGAFTHSGPAPMPGAARWDGAAWRSLGKGFDRGDGTAAVEFRDRLYVAGRFSGVDGILVTRVIAWDGMTWFPVPWSDSQRDYISSLAVVQDRLYAGGFFEHADTVATRNLASWDGERWSRVDFPSFGYGITAMATHADNLIVAQSYGGLWKLASGKWIQSYSNLSAGYITSILADEAGSVVTGSIDATGPGSTETLGYKVLAESDGVWRPLQVWSGTMHGFAPGASVLSLARYGTDIVASGTFESVADGSHWARVGGLARWNGSEWRAFAGWPASYGAVYGMLTIADTLLVVGTFHNLSSGKFDVPGYRFDGAHWAQLDTLSSVLRCPTLYRGSLYMAGSPSMGNTQESGGLYRLDGTHWTKIADISSPYNNPEVFALAVHGDRLVAGGWFDHIGGITATNVAAWDGSTWMPMGELLPGSLSPPVIGFAELDTTLYVAGSFGAEQSSVARWDGSAWQMLGSPSGFALAMTAFDGQIVAAVRDKDTFVHELVGWDGMGWTHLATLNEHVLTLLTDAQQLWLGGYFSLVDGVPSSRIALWETRRTPPGAGVTLAPVVPNPSRGAVAFSYEVATAASVALTVCDANGRHVATLDSGWRLAGKHAAGWDGLGADKRRVPAGIYFLRVAVGDGKAVGRKIVLLP